MKVRICARLPEATLQALQDLHPDRPTTSLIEDGLEHLLRDLHHDIYPAEFVATLSQRDPLRTPRRAVNLRLNKQYVDYIRLNVFNLTTCITTALKLYILP